MCAYFGRMTPKQADARRLIDRGCTTKEIQSALRLLYGQGIHTSELASIRRGDKVITKVQSGVPVRPLAEAKPPAPAKAEAKPAHENAQLRMAVDAPTGAAGKNILLRPNGTWAYTA